MHTPTIETINQRLLNAQKDIKLLKNSAYADHRLMEKMDKKVSVLAEAGERLTKLVALMNEKTS